MTNPTARGKVDVAFVNPFLEGTVQVIKTMCQCAEVKRTQMVLKDDYTMYGDISGVMGISGKVRGSVAVTFPKDLAAKLVASMLGMEVEAVPKNDIHDGVGELINMISGNAKTKLSGTDYSFNISLPTIVAGPQHEILHKSDSPCIMITFEADGTPFTLQICLGANA